MDSYSKSSNTQNHKIILPNAILFQEVEQEIGEGKSVIITLRGNSMSPLLRDDLDKVKLSPISSQQDLKINDVVLFRYHNNYFLHRIRQITTTHYVMQGDALSTQETASFDNIIAILTEIIRPDGSIINCKSKTWKIMTRKVLLKVKLKKSCIGKCIRKIKQFAKLSQQE